MIVKPTIGRIVWYRQTGLTENEGQPQAAVVAFVHNDRMVNLTVSNYDGTTRGETSVTLVQEDGGAPATGGGPVRYCEWMPYQHAQAKKHAAEDAATDATQTAAKTARDIMYRSGS